MFKRLMLIGLLIVSAVVIFETNAHAGSIAGFSFKCCSEVEGLIDLRGVPNPDTKPTVVIVGASFLAIEVLCLNPAGHIVPGVPGQLKIATGNQVDKGDIVSRGRALVPVTLPFAETDATCVNSNWIPNSAVVTDMLVTIQWFRCQGGDLTDNDPCFDDTTPTIGTTPVDSVTAECILDPVLRNPDGTVVHGQVMDCVEVN